MDKIKLFEEFSEKLWQLIDFNDPTYCEDPTVIFNQGLLKEIISRLSVDASGKWRAKPIENYVELGYYILTHNYNSTKKLDSINIFQTQDDYFICDWSRTILRSDLYKCDSEEGLLQMLSHFKIIN